jgi:hypothetical protein
MSLVRKVGETVAEPDIDGARRAATKLIEDYAITDPAQISIHDIAFDRHVTVIEEDMTGAEGRLLRKGANGLIRVRPNPTYPGRVRFAIGHELGHWERHMNISQAWLCSSRDIHAYSGSAAEIEANAFAGELLMPSSLLKPRLYSGLSIQTLIRVATEFQTSLTATAVRSVEDTTEDAYVIFSQDGIVRWWKRSSKADRYFQRVFTLREESRALSCNVPPDESNGMQQVDLNAWFDYRKGDSGVELWEESVYFYDLDTVMTLLALVS